MSGKCYLTVLLLCFTTTTFEVTAQMKHRTEIILLMGSRFEITPYSASDSLNERAIVAAVTEVKRIEQLISEWLPTSEIAEVNKYAGIRPVKVTPELFGLVKRSLKVSMLTNGAFDISWAAARHIWRFDGSMTSLPDQQTIDSVKPLVDFRNIILDDSLSTIYLTKKGMAVGLGAIGKGYAANRCRDVMKVMGIDNGIVIAGGDLITWGSPDQGKQWQIGIANPEHTSKPVAWFEIGAMSVVTSGDYEHFVMIDQKRYSHIIDPTTCYPVGELRSVTIVCPDAELADALATAVFVMGPVRGMALVNQLIGVECVMINDRGTISTSDNLQINTGKSENQHTLIIGK